MNGLKFSAAATIVLSLGTTGALAKDWYPFKIAAAKNGDLKQVEQIAYVPLDKAEKPWKLCVLFPHMQDTYWLSVDYGIVEEAKRLGVKINLYQAGGYTQLPKQISQYDDCMAPAPTPS